MTLRHNGEHRLLPSQRAECGLMAMEQGGRGGTEKAVIPALHSEVRRADPEGRCAVVCCDGDERTERGHPNSQLVVEKGSVALPFRMRDLRQDGLLERLKEVPRA